MPGLPLTWATSVGEPVGVGEAAREVDGDGEAVVDVDGGGEVAVEGGAVGEALVTGAGEVWASRAWVVAWVVAWPEADLGPRAADPSVLVAQLDAPAARPMESSTVTSRAPTSVSIVIPPNRGPSTVAAVRIKLAPTPPWHADTRMPRNTGHSARGT